MAPPTVTVCKWSATNSHTMSTQLTPYHSYTVYYLKRSNMIGKLQECRFDVTMGDNCFCQRKPRTPSATDSCMLKNKTSENGQMYKEFS